MEFTYTGGIQTYTIEETGRYLLEVYGAKGGTGGKNGSTSGGSAGGNGGYSRGEIQLTAGTILYIVCGGAGGNLRSTGGGVAGYNGGGAGGTYRDSDNDYHSGGGGGGATHIATVTGTLSSIGIENIDKVLIIAGGGGGGALYSSAGGAGGGLTGGNSNYSGATQSTGYAFGLGRSGSGNAGGGGGGYYGGESGNRQAYTAGGAGGGSGYIENLNNGHTEQNSNNGNGLAVITKLADPYNCRYKVNGTWKNAMMYIKQNGTWKTGTPFIILYLTSKLSMYLFLQDTNSFIKSVYIFFKHFYFFHL